MPYKIDPAFRCYQKCSSNYFLYFRALYLVEQPPAPRHDKLPGQICAEAHEKAVKMMKAEKEAQAAAAASGQVTINIGCDVEGCIDDNFCIEVILAAFDFFRVSEMKQD